MKMLKAVVIMALVLLMAAPAFAEIKLNGLYRLQGTHYDTDSMTDADQWITQRLRLKLTDTLNENVSFVYYGEIDLDWGGPDKFGFNGAQLGADGNAIETKNVYLTVQDGDMSATLGIQDTKDIFNGLIIWDDAAGANFKVKAGPADVNVLYAKFSEGTKNVDDDRDFYGATVGFAATEALKVSAGVYVDDKEAVTTTTAASTCLVGTGCAGGVAFGAPIAASTSTAAEATNVYYGLRVDAKAADMVDVSAFGVVADMENGDTYVLDANANVKFGMGNVLAEVMYIPEDDSATGGDTFAQISPLYYNKHNSMMMFRDLYATNNTAGEGKYNGQTKGVNRLMDGLTLLALSGNFDFDVAYAGFGVLWAEGETLDIGTEFFAKVGKKFFGNVDVSIRAAQWNGGDFDTADDETKVIGMVNVGF